MAEAPLGYEYLSAVPRGSIWFHYRTIYPALRLFLTGSCPALFLPVAAGLVSKP